MKKRKLFSNADGTSFGEDAKDISEELKASFSRLPLELKKLLPIAEDIVRALQNLDDMLEEGHPVNEAIEKVLAMTKSEVDDRLFEIIKQAIDGAIETMQGLGELTIPGESKKFEASIALGGYSNVADIQADTAIQLAVYAVKS